MPRFDFECLDERGGAVAGQVEAVSEKEADRELRSKGLFPTRIEAIREAPPRKQRKPRPEPPTAEARQARLEPRGLRAEPLPGTVDRRALFHVLTAHIGTVLLPIILLAFYWFVVAAGSGGRNDGSVPPLQLPSAWPVTSGVIGLVLLLAAAVFEKLSRPMHPFPRKGRRTLGQKDVNTPKYRADYVCPRCKTSFAVVVNDGGDPVGPDIHCPECRKLAHWICWYCGAEEADGTAIYLLRDQREENTQGTSVQESDVPRCAACARRHRSTTLALYPVLVVVVGLLIAMAVVDSLLVRIMILLLVLAYPAWIVSLFVRYGYRSGFAKSCGYYPATHRNYGHWTYRTVVVENAP